MKRRLLRRGADDRRAFTHSLALAGCTTVETRIAEKQETFRRLSPDRSGCWCSREKFAKACRWTRSISRGVRRVSAFPAVIADPSSRRGSMTRHAAGDYPGPFNYGYGYGYGARLRILRRIRSPLSSWRGLSTIRFTTRIFTISANIVRYPERTVSFQNGRVIAFQFLPAPRFY